MRITFLCPVLTQNGGNRVIAIYAEKLVALGHDVTVIARKPAEPDTRSLRGIYRLLRHGRKRVSPNRMVFFRNLGDRVIELEPDQHITPDLVPDGDVVIATWWRTAFDVVGLPPQKGAKAYFVQHHEVHDHQPKALAGGSYHLPLKKIAVAGWLAREMGETYGDHDTVVVPNAVDTDYFDAPARARNTPPRVGLMYAATPFKGVDISLKAIEIARRDHPDLDVVAFGRGEPQADLPLPPRTTYHRDPAQSDIPGIYAACDAWMVGSRSEGFGLPILEAMACRTPVVATQTGAAPDLIETGRNGMVVPLEDPDAMGRALSDLLSQSPDDWRAMSDAAYVTARSWSWDDAAQAFEAALIGIAGR